MHILTFLTETLTDASNIAQKAFKNVENTTKASDNNQVLTETDIEIGTFIIDKIKRFFPNDSIIDEEAGVIAKRSEYVWVVDPIDGTSNFASGLPTYGVMIGLLRNDVPFAGGIILPFFNQLYLAQKGEGAFCNSAPICVTKEEKLSSSLIAYGIDGHREEPIKTYNEMKTLAEIILQCRNLRTTNSAYDMVQVASGAYGAYLNQTTKIWDNIALQPIIEEAGGIVTDFYGQTIDYTNPLERINENFTICAASPALHQQLQAIINTENKNDISL